MTSPIHLTPEEEAARRKKKTDAFKEKYNALCEETGIRLMAMLDIGPLGVKPVLTFMDKIEAPAEEKPAATTDNGERKTEE